MQAKMTERKLHKCAFMLLNGMALLDERAVPAALGGGIVARPKMTVYELRSLDGRIEFVASCGMVGKGATLARHDMLNYLLARATGGGGLPDGYRRCVRCGRSFRVTHPNRKYCSARGKWSCKYLSQRGR